MFEITGFHSDGDGTASWCFENSSSKCQAWRVFFTPSPRCPHGSTRPTHIFQRICPCTNSSRATHHPNIHIFRTAPSAFWIPALNNGKDLAVTVILLLSLQSPNPFASKTYASFRLARASSWDRHRLPHFSTCIIRHRRLIQKYAQTILIFTIQMSAKNAVSLRF